MSTNVKVSTRPIIGITGNLTGTAGDIRETDGITPAPPRMPRLLANVVFVLRDSDGNQVSAFDLKVMPRAVAPTFEEVAVPSHVGNVGTGIWKVSGDLALFQNDRWSINALKLHQGQIWEMYLRFRDGVCLATTTVNSGGGWSTDALYTNGYAYSRFANLAAYRSQFGVQFVIKDDMGDFRRAHIIISGATADKFDFFMATEESFYALFPKLN